MNEHLDREEFRLWLATQDPDAVVGVLQASAGCPIANYLVKGLGCQRAFVNASQAIVVGRRGERAIYAPVPLWVRDFVRSIDRGGHAITAKYALGVLDEAQERGEQP